MSDHILEAASGLARQITDQGYQIAGDEDLTPQARAQRIDALWVDAEAKMNGYREEYQRATAEGARRAEREVVRPPSNDPARLSSYRSALDRASAAQEADRLSAVLEEAEMIGDEDQALAAFTVALRTGDSAVVEAFLADRPSRRAAYDEYARHASRSMQQTLMDGMALSLPPKPSPGSRRMFG